MEVLLLLAALGIAKTTTQAIIPGTKYERVLIQANSFNDIRTTNMGGVRWDS